jgi:hypothetical protein
MKEVLKKIGAMKEYGLFKDIIVAFSSNPVFSFLSTPFLVENYG